MHDHVELWEAYARTRSIDNRNRLAVFYQAFVSSLARALMATLPRNALLDQQDLEGYGQIGLLQALESFDPARGLKFETFATLRVRGAMLDGIRHIDWVPRLERSRKVENTPQFRSIERVAGDEARPEGRRTIGQQIADYRHGAPTAAAEACEWLEGLGLTPQERAIVEGYYGDELTMKQVGASLDLSESRVSQVHSLVMNRLRERWGTRRALLHRCGGGQVRQAQQRRPEPHSARNEPPRRPGPGLHPGSVAGRIVAYVREHGESSIDQLARGIGELDRRRYVAIVAATCSHLKRVRRGVYGLRPVVGKGSVPRQRRFDRRRT